MYQDELMHSGVKGMRWGVRKARPSSGSGGKKAARKKVQTKARKIKRTRLSEIDRARNETARRAMLKAEHRISGVGLAKVPGKLEWYHAYTVGKVRDARGRESKVHAVSQITGQQMANRIAIGLAAAGAISMAYRV